ncbi:MAG: ROK family transcriptional regulator, partial [Planktomarina sp.]|nr:ROK family transcriptional regulator [Planktomarina sp.]
MLPKKSQNVDSMRNFNRASVMKLILENRGIDRSQLANETGLTNAAMTRIVQELLNVDLVKETGSLKVQQGRGRRSTGLEINTKGGYVLGLSILASNTSVALTDISGTEIASVSVQPSDLSDAKRTLDEISAAAFKMIDDQKIRRDQVLTAGVAIAGYLDVAGHLWLHSPYLRWPAFDVRKSLEKRLGMPITVENVNRCVAVAETRIGCCAGMSDIFLVRVGLGLGVATISNGKILRGHNNTAGQIGHFPASQDGAMCSCGKSDCITMVASGWAILEQLGLRNATVDGVLGIEDQDEKLRRVLKKSLINIEMKQVVQGAGSALGSHCVAMLRAIDPQRILLTGPVGRSPIFGKAFCEQLTESGVTTKVITANDQSIFSPAIAASALSLAENIYSSTFNIQKLLIQKSINESAPENFGEFV